MYMSPHQVSGFVDISFLIIQEALTTGSILIESIKGMSLNGWRYVDALQEGPLPPRIWAAWEGLNRVPQKAY